MGNSGSRNDQNKSKRTKAAATRELSVGAAEESAAAAAAEQRLRQSSVWSFGSLSGRLNWSFTGASRNSFHHRSKSNRKSLTPSQQQRRSKTAWHKPLTNAIFSTHFPESSRNEQFHIEHLIAKGAFGVVFKVIDKHHEQPKGQQRQRISHKTIYEIKDRQPSTAPYYALKVLKKSKIIEENSVQQIKDEADIQKVCGHHPFIVQQINLWQNRRNLHILSEYIPNGELFSKIAQFSIDLVRLYLAEIALGLDFLHNAGIIYRDAKPENILLTENYHIKLIDFGLSKWLKLGSTTKTMCGTFQYMAPEILRGDAYGHAVDWWSLGIIGCQMLTQKSPDIKKFITITLGQHEVDNAAPQTIVTDELIPLPSQKKQSALECQTFLPTEVNSLPHEAKDTLKRLLQVDPKQRLRSVLGMQKIALYKNFKINSEYLLNINPLELISRDNIPLYKDHECDETSSAIEMKAFALF